MYWNFYTDEEWERIAGNGVDERYLGVCVRCGKESLKRNMVAICAKHGTYSNPKTIGHMCEDCFAEWTGSFESM